MNIDAAMVVMAGLVVRYLDLDFDLVMGLRDAQWTGVMHDTSGTRECRQWLHREPCHVWKDA